jgi:DNA-binding transcriptional LysR family regulator
MELRHLRYFVAVAEELHFGRAARRLHIAQPPLSQQIKQLEQELGVQLLLRSTRRVELTDAGARYLERARSILRDVEAASDLARRVGAGLAGRVALGFAGSATYELLPALARLLREELPLVELELRGEMLTPDQVAALVDRRLDVGFLRPPVRDASLIVRVLRREPLIAVVPSTHVLAGRETVHLEDLRDDPFITYPAGHRSVVYDTVMDACANAGFEPASQIEVAETSTLVCFVAAGLGVALVPSSVTHLAVKGAVFCPLAGTDAEVALAVATRSDDNSPQVARVLELTEKLLGTVSPN